MTKGQSPVCGNKLGETGTGEPICGADWRAAGGVKPEARTLTALLRNRV